MENNIDATTISHSGDWLGISVPVGQANKIFDTNFSIFTHDESGAQIIRALQYSIPEDLVNHLQVVHPVTTFLVSPPRSAATGSRSIPLLPVEKRQSACGGHITHPECLLELYGIPTTAATNPEKLVVTGYFNESPSMLDAEVRS